MKKNVKIVALMLVSCIIILSACSKNPEKVLPKKDGKWNGTYTESVSLLGFSGSTTTGSFTATFDKGGSGSWASDSTNFNFAWSCNKSGNALSITPQGQTPIVFTVSDEKRKSETWNTSYSIADTSGFGFGVTVSMTANIKRAD